MIKVKEFIRKFMDKKNMLVKLFAKNSNKVKFGIIIFIVLITVVASGGVIIGNNYFQRQNKINPVKVLDKSKSSNDTTSNKNLKESVFSNTVSPTVVPTPTLTDEILSTNGYIGLLSPSGYSNTWRIDSTQTITWNSVNILGSIAISLQLVDVHDKNNKYSFSLGTNNGLGKFVVPSSIPLGSYWLYVIANKYAQSLGGVSITIADSAFATPAPTLVPIPDPKIDSVSPSSGPAGQEIVIKGSNFGSNADSVIFCPQGSCNYGAPIVSWTDTEIKARVPGALTKAEDHQFYVHNYAGKISNKFIFTITAGQPIVDSISPSSGAKPGGELVIAGSNFGTGNGQVNFYKSYPVLDGAGTITSWSDNEIKITIPSSFMGNTEYGIQIINGGGAGSSFKYYTLGAN